MNESIIYWGQKDAILAGHCVRGAAAAALTAGIDFVTTWGCWGRLGWPPTSILVTRVTCNVWRHGSALTS